LLLTDRGHVAADLASEGEPIDFLRVTRGNRGVGQYMIEELKPFYDRVEG